MVPTQTLWQFCPIQGKDRKGTLQFKGRRGANKVGTETMVSALKKTLSPEFESCDTPTHPSLKRRIDHLRRIEKKAKKN